MIMSQSMSHRKRSCCAQFRSWTQTIKSCDGYLVMVFSSLGDLGRGTPYRLTKSSQCCSIFLVRVLFMFPGIESELVDYHTLFPVCWRPHPLSLDQIGRLGHSVLGVFCPLAYFSILIIPVAAFLKSGVF
jgi:hypothetical protein